MQITRNSIETATGPSEWFTGTVYFAPDERHWHGATSESHMVHMAINIATTTEGGTDWQEPVTDEQYASG